MVQFELLDQMQRLCAGSRCRHRALSEYFGQAYEKRSCDACDVCLDELEAVPDSTEIASKILSCVARVKQSFGAAYIIDVLRGRSTAKVKDRRHDELSTFGILSEVSKETLGAYINQLTDDGGLAREGLEFPILRLNERSVRILKGQETVTFRRPRSVLSEVAPSGPGGVPLSPAEMSLFESLRALRRNIAEELGVPPFAVFADTTLEEMSKVRPASGATLVTIKGIGQVKLAEFGERFLTHIREYGAAHGLALDAARGSRNRSDAARDRSSPGRAKQPRGRGASGPLYAAGKSIDEVATALGIVRNTAAAHLSDYILSERPESIETWVPPDVYAEVAAAVAKFPGNLLRPIFEFLGEAVPYEQIRLVVNHLQVVQDRQAGKPAALP
jgi:ATP-dependent DNA helicase RecQ